MTADLLPPCPVCFRDGALYVRDADGDPDHGLTSAVVACLACGYAARMTPAPSGGE